MAEDLVHKVTTALTHHLQASHQRAAAVEEHLIPVIIMVETAVAAAVLRLLERAAAVLELEQQIKVETVEQ
jgi:hypothetical protein